MLAGAKDWPAGTLAGRRIGWPGLRQFELWLLWHLWLGGGSAGRDFGWAADRLACAEDRSPGQNPCVLRREM